MPRVGDGRQFIKIISQAENNKNAMFDQFTRFITDIIKRDDPPANAEETQELELFVDRNLLPLLNRCMVAFGLTTEEELEKYASLHIELPPIFNTILHTKFL